MIVDIFFVFFIRLVSVLSKGFPFLVRLFVSLSLLKQNVASSAGIGQNTPNKFIMAYYFTATNW